MKGGGLGEFQAAGACFGDGVDGVVLVEGDDAFAAVFEDAVLEPLDFAPRLDGLGGEAPEKEEDGGFDGHSEEEGDAGAVVGGGGQAAFGVALVAEGFAEVGEGGGGEGAFLLVAAPFEQEIVAGGVSRRASEGIEGACDGFAAVFSEGGEGGDVFAEVGFCGEAFGEVGGAGFELELAFAGGVAGGAGVEQVGDEGVFHLGEMEFHFGEEALGVGEEDEAPMVLAGALVGLGEGDKDADEGEQGEDETGDRGAVDARTEIVFHGKVSGFLTVPQVLRPAVWGRGTPNEDSRINRAGCRAFLGA